MIRHSRDNVDEDNKDDKKCNDSNLNPGPAEPGYTCTPLQTVDSNQLASEAN